MSNAKMSAVDDIRKLGRTLKGLIDFADEIERVGSLENAAKEAEGRLSKYKADEIEASKGYLEAKAKHDAQQIIVDEMLNEAKEKSDEIIKAASEKAAAIVSDAQSRGYGLKAEAEAFRAKALSEAKAIEAEIKVLGLEKSELEGVVNGLKAELEALKKRIG